MIATVVSGSSATTYWIGVIAQYIMINRRQRASPSTIASGKSQVTYQGWNHGAPTTQ
ncbi:MAG: hypothetical protein ACHREM_23090 [Polyangiales bacterium]